MSILDQKGIKDDQIRWEHIKSEIRQFTIIFFFFENLSNSLNAKGEIFEKKLKDYKKSGSTYFGNEDYIACKTKLDKIYDKEVEVFRIRSKCEWYTKKEKNLLNSS